MTKSLAIEVPETIQEKYDRVEYGTDKVYFPTEREQLLLEALLNPDYADMAMHQKIADVAGVSRSTYVRAMNKPGFIRAYQQLFMNGLQGMVPSVVKAMHKFAVNGAANNSDRMGILKLAGLVEDRKTIDINKKSMKVDVKMESAPTEELKEIIRQMIRENPKLIEGVVEEDE